ncbi:MAG TPA: hypothetical protein VEI02_07550, partial [Planctomycetota bacterium]|nr:hypothetical protein [Planctomycetota bacterium]
MPARRLALVRAAFLAALLAAPSFAQVTTHTSLAAFNAAAGNPPVAVTFDDLAPGTDLSGVHRGGVTFVATGAPLLVVAAAATFTPAGFTGAPNPAANVLPATTGAHVLSPGGVVLGPGPDPAVEADGLTLTFDAPVSAFGFDHLSQSADGFSFSSVQVKDANGAVLFSGTVPISNLGGGGAAAGADFFGVVATSAIIKSVVVSEGDSNSQFPDCNIGYDTLRFTPSAVPAAATFTLGGGCGAGVPTLFASPPLLGGAATLSVTGCTPNAGG